MSIIYYNSKYYLQIIAKKSWRYIIFAKKGIEYNNTIIIIEMKMKTKLIESLDFTEEEYNEKTAGEDIASFNEFIDAVIAFVEQSGGTLEDAIVMANEAYYQL